MKRTSVSVVLALCCIVAMIPYASGSIDDGLAIYLAMTDGNNYITNSVVDNLGNPSIVFSAQGFTSDDYNNVTGLFINGEFGEYQNDGIGSPKIGADASTNMRTFLPENNVTVAIFFKADGQVTPLFEEIFSIRGGGAKLQLAKLPNGSLRFSIRDDAETTELLPELPATLLDGTYHHFAATVEDLGNNTHELKLYADGTEILAFLPTFTSSIITSSCNPAVAGQGCQVSGNLGIFNVPFNGSLDDFRVYNRTLSAAEIMELADLPKTPPECRDSIDNDNDGLIDFPNDPDCEDLNDNRERPITLADDLIIYLPMADSNNYITNSVVDNLGDPNVVLSAQGFTVNNHNNETGLFINGSFGEYISDGTGSAQIAADASTNMRTFIPENHVSVSVFFRADGQVTSQFEQLFSIRGGGAKIQLTKMPNGSMRFSLRDESETTDFLPELSASFLDGTYHHFAATVEDLGNTTHELVLYVDGIAVETFFPLFTSSVITSSCNPGPIDQGCEVSGDIGIFNEIFNGSLDDFRLYNRTLNATEVAQLANLPQAVAQCRDNVDNDNNGLKDFPNDPGCSSLDDATEASPDFVPTSLNISTSDPIIGQQLNVSVVVKNEGAETASGTLTLFDGATSFHSEPITSLAPGAQVTITTDFTPTTGSHTILASVSGVTPPESDVTNNNLSLVILPRSVVACGDIILEDTFLGEDLFCSSGHGITFGAENIALDCRGHSITGANSSGTRGVNVVGSPRKNGISVINCTVRDFNIGIRLAQSNVSLLIDNTVEGNNNQGILLATGAHSNSILQNTVFNNGAHGIRVTTHAHTIMGNEAFGNGASGIQVASSQASTVESNVAHNNTNEGIFVTGGQAHSVRLNIAMDNTKSGIRLRQTRNGVVSENRADQNGEEGFRIDRGRDHVLDSNMAFFNGLEGIRFRQGNGHVLTNSTFCDSTGSDIRASTSANSGDDNRCDTTDNWDDDGTTGCTFACP